MLGSGRRSRPRTGATRRCAAPSTLRAFVFAAALGVAALGAAGPAGATTFRVWVPDGVQTMTEWNGLVHWTSDLGCPGGEFPTTCRMGFSYSFRARGSDVPAYDNADGPREHDFASRAVGNYAYQFWIGQGGDVLRLRGEGPPEVLATKEDPTSWGDIDCDEEYVYWTENVGRSSGKLFRVPVGGGAPELMRHNRRWPLENLRADRQGGVLLTTSLPVHLVCCYGVLERVVPDGAGGFATTVARQQGVVSITSLGPDAYWITRLGDRSRPNLRSAPLADLTADTRLAELPSGGDPDWPVLTADPRGVYWQQVGGPARSGPVWYLPAEGGEPFPITADFGTIDRLEGAGGILFARSGRRIYRAELDATSRAVDIVGDEVGLEVVQVLQNSDHDVPLVADKRTFVRAYGRIGEDAAARPDVYLLRPVVLHGTRDGVRLPGSPLLPVAEKNLLPIPVDRTTLDTTTLFELPHAWTRGTVTLRAEWNPSRWLAETDFGNNVSERTVTFEDGRDLCVEMLLVLTHAGVSSPGVTTAVSQALGRVGSHLVRAGSLMPTDRIAVSFNGGPPRVRPLIGDPYNLRDDLHKSQLMMNLSVEFTLRSAPAACGERRTVRTVMAPDSNRYGLSYGAGPYIYFLRDTGGSGVNSTFGGVAGLAHELAHQLGRPHVNCSGNPADVPANPDPNYPYNPCFLDDTNDHIGFDSISQQLIVPVLATGMSGATDYMAYGPTPAWSSDYTFRGIFDQLRLGAAGDAAPVSGGGGGAGDAGGDPSPNGDPIPPPNGDPIPPPNGDPIPPPPPSDEVPPPMGDVETLLLGGLAPEDGPAYLGYAWLTDEPEEVSARIARYAPVRQDFELRTYDASGVLVGVHPVRAGRIEAEDGSDTLALLQLFENPAELPVTRVELVHATRGVLAARAAGANPPELSLLVPATGELVDELLVVDWDAFDPDGDDLRYLVRYSPDDGRTWVPLGADLLAPPLEIDGTFLPGSERAWVEVVASDGLHATSAFAGPFLVPRRLPQPVILDAAGLPWGSEDTLSVAQSEALSLTGRAWDAEEGELGDEALLWTLDGPEARTVSGRTLLLRDLAPGRYELSLWATDGDQGSDVTTTTLLVGPKQIAPGLAPALDGRCDDVAWRVDGDPIAWSAGAALPAEVRLMTTKGALWLCATGLPLGDGRDAQLVVTLGGSPNGPAARYVAVGTDGLLETGTLGPKGERVPDAGVSGAAAAADGFSEHWSAELRLDGPGTGGQGTVGIRLAHRVTDGQTRVEAAWPAGSLAGSPGSWGAAVFTADPPPAPPVVVVPEDVVVRAADAAGAVVTFDVTAYDPTDPQPSVRCTPPSGALFPIGVTTVTCVARAASGLWGTGSFRVIVLDPAARDRIRAVRGELAAALSGADRQSGRTLRQAIVQLDLSLLGLWWRDDDALEPLLGGAVLVHLSNAARHLAALPPAAEGGAAGGELADIGTALAGGVVDEAAAALLAATTDPQARTAQTGPALDKAYAALEEARLAPTPVASLRASHRAWQQAQVASRILHAGR